LRVLYVSDVYFPRVNGVSTSIRTFRDDLAAVGVATNLIAPAYAPADTAERLDGDSIVRIPAAAVPLDPEDRRMRWRALVEAIERQHAQSPFTAIHIQTPFLAHYAGVRAARRFGLPVIATYHTFFEDYLHHYLPVLPRSLGRSIARSFTRSQCRDVDLLIAPSAPMSDALVQYGVRTPIAVIPTGLPAESFLPGEGARFRQRFAIPADRKLVGYVGRVAHEKNIEFLLRMFVQARRTEPAALLLIAGEGPALPRLRTLAAALGINEHVRFVGYLERNPGLLDCYAALDVFAFASRTETQGLVLLEAMAQGTAVVSTAELGTRSILTPESGANVMPEDEQTFAAAVAALLADPAARETRSPRLRAYAQKWASRESARRLAAAYVEVVDRFAAQKNAAPGGAAVRP
jgi:hypothetical protein